MDPIGVDINYDTQGSPWSLCIPDFGNSPADEIIARHLPGMVEMFRQKSRDYQTDSFGTHEVLGAKGQFAELWRKMGKLKRSMWDDQPMQFENTEEILFDLFGHIMLAVDLVKRNGSKKS